jgi:MFS family permease
MDEEQNQTRKEPHSKSSRKFYLALVSLFLITFVASFNSVVLASSLPAITLDLNASSDKAFWTGTAFLVCQTVTTPIFGVLSDFLGRKIVLLANLCAFMIAAALCSTAQSIEWLVGARVVRFLHLNILQPQSSLIPHTFTDLHANIETP